MYLKSILDEFSPIHGLFIVDVHILKDTGTAGIYPWRPLFRIMKKNIFVIALIISMLLMTACANKEVVSPSPTVPAATIPAENNSNNPITTTVPEPTAPAATTTPESTENVQ